jgi:hypothetical protein
MFWQKFRCCVNTKGKTNALKVAIFEHASLQSVNGRPILCRKRDSAGLFGLELVFDW